MPLINPLPEGVDPAFDELIEHYKTTSGYVPNALFALQRRPKILHGIQNLHRAAMETHPDSRVTPELKVLLAHVASGAAGCRYCQAHTAYGAEKRGENPERIAHIWEYRTSPLFTDAERAALELAQAAGVTPNAVTPEMQETARKFWTDDELVEIMAIICVMGFMNRWNDTVTTPLEGPPREYAFERLKDHGWEPGRH